MNRTERDRLILEYLPLVKTIAMRLHENLPAHVELDDLISAGELGLIEAASKFDGTKSVPFASYAKHRIRGAILDNLRAVDWASRDMRAKSRRAELAKQELQTNLGRNPTEEELAAHQGLSLAEWRKVEMQIRGLISASTRNAEHDDLPDPDFACPAHLHPDRMCLDNELSQALQGALGTLTPRFRRVMELYYQHNLTMLEIGAILGVNESRVSQIHRAALEKLHGHLKSQGIAGVKAFAAAA